MPRAAADPLLVITAVVLVELRSARVEGSCLRLDQRRTLSEPQRDVLSENSGDMQIALRHRTV